MSPVLRLYFRSVATLSPSCYFPARSINMDTRQGSQSTASRAREIKPADGRDISAGKCSAANRAPREGHENKSAPPARPPADNPIRTCGEHSRTIVTRSGSAVPDEPRGPLPLHPLLPLPPAPRRITRHTMPIKFQAKPLITNDRVPNYSTHKSRGDVRLVGRGFDPAESDGPASLPFAPLHPREFAGASLTNSRSGPRTGIPTRGGHAMPGHQS
jgi:hypothetical protein